MSIVAEDRNTLSIFIAFFDKLRQYFCAIIWKSTRECYRVKKAGDGWKGLRPFLVHALGVLYKRGESCYH